MPQVIRGNLNEGGFRHMQMLEGGIDPHSQGNGGSSPEGDEEGKAALLSHVLIS
ncbi:MAG: hypothetical protein HY717_05920 [Planctomycetes bacterium]|nr:hypothetical protein [Planctomycetota bacterium]